MGSNTGKSAGGTCVLVAALIVSARLNGWFPKTAQHGPYLPSLFAIHELFLKIQF